MRSSPSTNAALRLFVAIFVAMTIFPLVYTLRPVLESCIIPFIHESRPGPAAPICTSTCSIAQSDLSPLFIFYTIAFCAAVSGAAVLTGGSRLFGSALDGILRPRTPPSDCISPLNDLVAASSMGDILSLPAGINPGYCRSSIKSLPTSMWAPAPAENPEQLSQNLASSSSINTLRATSAIGLRIRNRSMTFPSSVPLPTYTPYIKAHVHSMPSKHINMLPTPPPTIRKESFHSTSAPPTACTIESSQRNLFSSEPAAAPVTLEAGIVYPDAAPVTDLEDERQDSASLIEVMPFTVDVLSEETYVTQFTAGEIEAKQGSAVYHVDLPHQLTSQPSPPAAEPQIVPPVSMEDIFSECSIDITLTPPTPTIVGISRYDDSEDTLVGPQSIHKCVQYAGGLAPEPMLAVPQVDENVGTPSPTAVMPKLSLETTMSSSLDLDISLCSSLPLFASTIPFLSPQTPTPAPRNRISKRPVSSSPLLRNERLGMTEEDVNACAQPSSVETKSSSRKPHSKSSTHILSGVTVPPKSNRKAIPKQRNPKSVLTDLSNISSPIFSPEQTSTPKATRRKENDLARYKNTPPTPVQPQNSLPAAKDTRFEEHRTSLWGLRKPTKKAVAPPRKSVIAPLPFAFVSSSSPRAKILIESTWVHTPVEADELVEAAATTRMDSSAVFCLQKLLRALEEISPKVGDTDATTNIAAVQISSIADVEKVTPSPPNPVSPNTRKKRSRKNLPLTKADIPSVLFQKRRNDERINLKRSSRLRTPRSVIASAPARKEAKASTTPHTQDDNTAPWSLHIPNSYTLELTKASTCPANTTFVTITTSPPPITPPHKRNTKSLSRSSIETILRKLSKGKKQKAKAIYHRLFNRSVRVRIPLWMSTLLGKVRKTKRSARSKPMCHPLKKRHLGEIWTIFCPSINSAPNSLPASPIQEVEMLPVENTSYTIEDLPMSESQYYVDTDDFMTDDTELEPEVEHPFRALWPRYPLTYRPVTTKNWFQPTSQSISIPDCMSLDDIEMPLAPKMTYYEKYEVYFSTFTDWGWPMDWTAEWWTGPQI